MSGTTGFFLWFYEGLNGLGGWFLFFLLALAGVIFLFYDAQKRRLPAAGWKLGIVLAACLLIPAIIFRFSSLETRASIANFSEPIFYLGLLGGVLPAVLAVGYYVTFQGLVGCPQGHTYDEVLHECPECNRINLKQSPRGPVGNNYGPGVTEIDPPSGGGRKRPSAPRYEPPEPVHPKAQAWLVAGNKSFQLNQGTTTIGRSTRNDIVLDGELTVSKEHAKIVEENGHFKLVDLASTNGTFLNGHALKKQVFLDADDEIRFGTELTLRFVNSNK